MLAAARAPRCHFDAPPPPPPVHPGDCDPYACGDGNGTRMTGLAVDVIGDIRTIILSSGEVFTLQ
jgi:hypothetical protein